MSTFETLDELAAQGNGYLLTSQVVDRGISRPALAAYVRKNGMERVERGVYLAKDAWEDALYQLCVANARLVFSHETALHLHGLMEREPGCVSATVCAGYNATHLRRRGVRVFQTGRELYELGATDVRTSFGNMVRAYDMERTLCDIIRRKDDMDVQVFRYAVREYMASGEKDLHRLMGYAEKLRVRDAVRTYTEVML